MDNKELFGNESVTEEPMQDLSGYEATQTVEEPEVTPEQIQEIVSRESKKGNNGAAVAIVTLLFVLVIGLCVYIAVSVSDMLSKPGQEDKEYEAQTADPWEEILGDDYIGANPEDVQNPAAESGADFGAGVHDYPNYSADAFEGPYYEQIVDCIDESVSYGIERKYYDVDEEEYNVHIATSYIQLEGDIPGLDAINSTLEENTTYFVDNYEKNKADLIELLNEDAGIEATIKSYVTYNTENMISVVVQENISLGYMYQDVKIRSYNINLDTGTILDNTSILNLRDGFGQEFRERSNKQNGISETGIEAFSNDEIEGLLNDKTSLIIFYTPLGMEVGYNYEKDGAIGWITISMQDYESYLMRM